MSRTTQTQMQMPPSPPLLLTKRVTAFLRANLSAHIHSAMLTTPAGSLLAHASNLPASALRRQAAVAASLWALQGPAHAAPAAPGAASATLPPGSTVRTPKSGRHPPTVTVQLDSGAVFVIRRLRCGMLFICMGGSEGAAAAAGRHTPTPPAPHNTRPSRSSVPTTPTPDQTSQIQSPVDAIPPISPTTAEQTPATATTASTTTAAASNLHPTPLLSTPADPPQPPAQPAPAQTVTTTPTTPIPHRGASVASGASAATTVPGSSSGGSGGGSNSSAAQMRRQVEELARWLDERLGGLYVPEEGIGIGIENRSGSGVAGTANGSAAAVGVEG
ncbi:91f17766-612b-4e09-bc69-dc968e4d0b9f [Thermothielavioides terrestris]|uniref:91f17766-612b-4e09-bc69-dc968e4d0b9f n=1 Tax=Thermothielavioides terrestris TaxID=2587410 RepID=A0A3S4AZ37_9PEZI|nr:91f17766-612b-4e09-bc69-dc968e4d0b9f [Thermothielavioides terrestris]